MKRLDHRKSSENQPKNVPAHEKVADVTSAVKSLSSLSLNTDNYCIQCALKFDDDTSCASHTKSDEHGIMVLVTGIAYFARDTQDLCGFPPLYYCALCNVFSLDYNSYERHLMGVTHKEMTHFMRNISFWKEKILVGQKCKNKEPSTSQDFEDLKHSPPHYCQLCDKQCNSTKTLENHVNGQNHKKLQQMVKDCKFCNISFVHYSYYKHHLKTDLHTRMKDFMSKMLIPAVEMTGTPKKTISVSESAEAKPLPMLYFCKLCNIEFNDVKSFRRHRKISTHVRVRNLINKMSIWQIKAPNPNEKTANESVSRIHYCELCNIWCLNFVQSYDEHVKSGSHLFTRSTEVVRNWDCSPKNHPVGLKPWS